MQVLHGGHGPVQGLGVVVLGLPHVAVEQEAAGGKPSGGHALHRQQLGGGEGPGLGPLGLRLGRPGQPEQYSKAKDQAQQGFHGQDTVRGFGALLAEGPGTSLQPDRPTATGWCSTYRLP